MGCSAASPSTSSCTSGTLLALLAYFARDWVRYLAALVASVRERRIAGDPERRLAWLLVMATIPAAIIGFLGEDLITSLFHGDSDVARLLIAGFLAIGAIALWLADRLGARRRESTELDAPAALTIGFSQALALIPGISRSGATITAGLALGLSREAAARFSFLLATPITLGAGLYGSRRLLSEAHSGTEWLAHQRRLRRCGGERHAGHRLPAVVAAAPFSGCLQRLSDPPGRAGGHAGGDRSLSARSARTDL